MVQRKPGQSGTSEAEKIEKCIAAIDLNNACRHFYITKVQSTEKCKREAQKQQTTGTNARAETSIDSSLSVLRHEMISLMDQDVSLMKQLLILNEQVEELKTKRLHAMSKEPLIESSQNLVCSQVSFSDTDMFGSDSNISQTPKLRYEEGKRESDKDHSLKGYNFGCSVTSKSDHHGSDLNSVDSLYTSGDHLLET